MNRMALLILTSLIFYSCSESKTDSGKFSSFDQAKLHPIEMNKPAIDFFDGALLGNGGMGAVVTTRPDAVVIYFGHNNVWDIRVSENNREKIKTFDYVFNKVKAIPDTLALLTDDPWYDDYSRMAQENYRKPYPRPFPCGSVLLGFDLRNAELLGHKLDVSNGLCEIYLLSSERKKIKLQIFTDMKDDKLWMRLTDENNNPVKSIFDRIRVMPDPSTPREFPSYNINEDLTGGTLSFRQVLPYQEPDKYDLKKGHVKDKAFSLSFKVNSGLSKSSRINWDGNEEFMGNLEASLTDRSGFIGYVTLDEGLNTSLLNETVNLPVPSMGDFNASLEESNLSWKAYWEKSGVELGDKFLEMIWYHNLYFLNCAVKEGVNTPGLFANWSYNNIGTAWHGDYHMNYNTQQPFWVTFSSNHLEKNLSYVSLIEFLMDVSRRWAKEYYKLPGAYFPHSAYPVDMTMNPYPVPHWGWEICETPWAVQGLWWHYLYSGDIDYLRNRGFQPIKEAVEFLVAYMKRPEARGPQWNDDDYHIFPTIPPELYALRPGFKYNYDCTVDLTLVKFIFNAFEQAVNVLGLQEPERDLLANTRDILEHYPEYPVAESEKYGKVIVSVPGEHSQVVYNVPNALITVFPGEDHGLHSDPATLDLVKNTFLNQQNEGGNDLVFKNLQAARIGMLDLEKFRRQINYCLLPNGTSADMAIQVHGRYNDFGSYGFMDHMGVWFENFALPAVINECLMQSYNGTIRLFPNWPMDVDAEFRDLRAAGAFLVNSRMKNGKIEFVRIVSESGTDLTVINPWSGGAKVITGDKVLKIKTKKIEVETIKGEEIIIKPF
ncbi:MAG TPA: glycoside hydrolase N-terminal domain-containing protein [Bacteroidales bacterium]|nr:glycoside hydrolase N-terminal domain-containing protein [Bacteroidales bacterium]